MRKLIASIFLSVLILALQIAPALQAISDRPRKAIR
jgi:hypothetical protein